MRPRKRWTGTWADARTSADVTADAMAQTGPRRAETKRAKQVTETRGAGLQARHRKDITRDVLPVVWCLVHGEPTQTAHRTLTMGEWANG